MWSQRFESQLKVMMGLCSLLVATTALVICYPSGIRSTSFFVAFFAAMVLLVIDYVVLFIAADQANLDLYHYGLRADVAVRLLQDAARWRSTLSDQPADARWIWQTQATAEPTMNLAGRYILAGDGWLVSGTSREGAIAGATWVYELEMAKQQAIARLATWLTEQGVIINLDDDAVGIDFPPVTGLAACRLARTDYEGWWLAWQELKNKV